MAGLGAKLFTDGSVLNAEQVNGYLMDQSIMRFATTAARDAAFGGVGEPTLAEGMFCYLDDTNQLQSYNGSAWVTIVNTDRPAGLEMVKSQTVGTSVSSVTVSNAFSTDYDNYKITYTGGVASTGGALGLRLGTTATGYYGAMIYGTTTGGGPTTVGYNNQPQWTHTAGMAVTGVGADFDLLSPFLTVRTRIANGAYTDDTAAGTINGFLADTTSYTSFLFVTSSGTITGGTITVFGYRKS